jgi:hypothetical protein
MTSEDVRIEKEFQIVEMQKNIATIMQLLSMQSDTMAELLNAGQIMRDILKGHKERIEKLEQGKNG